MSAVDVAIVLALVWLVAVIVRRLRPAPRHVWGELDSSSIAHAMRRR